MNSTELATLSMSELKAFCTRHAIDVIGDKRLKATWVNAIETFQSEQTVTEIETPDPFEDGYEFVINPETVSQSEVPDVLSIIDKSDNMTTLPQLTNGDAIALMGCGDGIDMPSGDPTPTQHRGASIVVLIPLILLSVAVVAIDKGFTSLIPIIVALKRFTGEIWQSVRGSNRGTNSIPIDYFPA